MIWPGEEEIEGDTPEIYLCQKAARVRSAQLQARHTAGRRRNKLEHSLGSEATRRAAALDLLVGVR